MLTRRHNQLDSFIELHAQPQHPHRTRHQERPVSPNRIANTRKPNLSPLRAPSPPPAHAMPKPKTPTSPCCANDNHRGKRAEYIIHIENEDMYYCGICATQAASQGFTVNRIAPPKRQKAIPHLPAFASNPRYQELTALMRDILRLEGEFKRRSPHTLEEHYRRQEGLLMDYYDGLANTVEQLRETHLKELRQEQTRSVAAGEMQFSHLQLHMEDLNEAWEDIEETFQDVIEKIDPQSFEEGMRAYRNTLNVCNHKLEEFDDGCLAISSFDSSNLAAKLAAAQQALFALWREGDSGQRRTEKTRANTPQPSAVRPSQPTNVKNMHEGLPKTANQSGEGQTAFRNLFPEDESEEHLPGASPQFKAF